VRHEKSNPVENFRESFLLMSKSGLRDADINGRWPTPFAGAGQRFSLRQRAAAKRCPDSSRASSIAIKGSRAAGFWTLKGSPTSPPLPGLLAAHKTRQSFAVFDPCTEQVRGAGMEHILAQASIQHDAEEMMEDVRAAVSSRPKNVFLVLRSTRL
jgi:hypothetical protein